MIWHITYTNDNMTISAKKCSDSAFKFGCDSSTIYKEADLDGLFLSRNKELLSRPRGCGYWAWKPQIILQELRECDVNDIVIYTDAGVEFINDVNHLVEAMGSQSCLLFGNNYLHHEWCKGDVYDMTPDYIGNQLQASAMLFRPSAQKIIERWGELCQIPYLIDDSPSVIQNQTGFQEHRHDQAILTAIAIQENIPFHWWPASYCDGKFIYEKFGKTDNYPVIFNHHRKRNNEWK